MSFRYIDPQLRLLIEGTCSKRAVSREYDDHIMLGVFNMICDGKVLCHEVKDGKEEQIMFRKKDGKIDDRIQQFIDVRDAEPPPIRMTTSSRQAADPGKMDNQQSCRDKGKGKGRGKGKVAPLAPSKKKGHTLVYSYGDQVNAMEREKDDEEPVKAEAPDDKPRERGDQEITTGGKSVSESQHTSSHSRTRSRETPEDGLDSDLNEPPSKRRQRTRLTFRNPIAVQDLTNTLARPNAASKDSKRNDNRTSTGNGAQSQRQAEPGIVREDAVPLTAIPDSSPTTSKLDDGLIIEELRLELQEAELQLMDYGDEEGRKERARVGILGTKLKIAQMQYQKKHGEMYVG